MKSILKYFSILVFCFVFIHPVYSQNSNAHIICSEPGPQTAFGISSLHSALQTYDGDVQIILSKLSDKKTFRSLEQSGIVVAENLMSEGFQIAVSKDKTTIAVLALGDAGLMYGAFELAEQITIAGIAALRDISFGIKLNLMVPQRIPVRRL